MKIERREFSRLGGLWLASLATRPLTCLAQAADETLPPPRHLLSWGTKGHGDGQFDVPIAIAINAKGEVLVTDFRQTADSQARLQRFDPNGRFLSSFELDPMPGGLALDKEGLLFATHMMLHKVVVYDPAGKPVREFGKLGTAPGEFQQPGGIAFGPDGSVYVADQVNHRVQRLTPQGEPIAAWGKYGVNTGEFGGKSSTASRVGGPHFVAFDSRAHIYTTEGSVGRVQKFTADGAFVLAWGDNEVGPGHFGGGKGLLGPIAIAIDGKDQAWVTSTNHTVQCFSSAGKYLRGVGGEGSEPGQFILPHGLAIDRQQNLYVADARNSRIQKFAL